MSDHEKYELVKLIEERDQKIEERDRDVLFFGTCVTILVFGHVVVPVIIGVGGIITRKFLTHLYKDDVTTLKMSIIDLMGDFDGDKQSSSKH